MPNTLLGTQATHKEQDRSLTRQLQSPAGSISRERLGDEFLRIETVRHNNRIEARSGCLIDCDQLIQALSELLPNNNPQLSTDVVGDKAMLCVNMRHTSHTRSCTSPEESSFPVGVKERIGSLLPEGSGQRSNSPWIGGRGRPMNPKV